MRITEMDTTGFNLTPKSSRSPGVHVSDVIRDISNTVLKPGQREKYDTLSRDEQKRLGNYASGGWAWEQIIRKGLIDAGVLLDQYVKPEEFTLNGIHGTPDWLDTINWVNVEFKATWRSSNRPLEPDFWEWICQFKAYCKMLACTATDLHVFFVNGDYRESGPQYKRYLLEFSKLEIEENWEMIRNHAKSKTFAKNSQQSTKPPR